MAQLIKLQDYISRYEQDIYHYSSQFVRLKRQQWNQILKAYEEGEIHKWTVFHKSETDLANEQEELNEGSKLAKIKSWFKRETEMESPTPPAVVQQPENPDDMTIERFLKFRPKSTEELKKHFLNQIFKFQLKWASSTVIEKSAVNANLYLDQKLRYFLQRFPDNCLVLYKPVFQLKNAPVETDIILLTPTEVWCLTFLEAEDDAVFLGGKDRFWIRKHHKKQDKKVLNPFIGLERMVKIVERIFTLNKQTLPIKKGIICRNGYIDDPSSPYREALLDKRVYEEWFYKIRNHQSPIKKEQLKAAEGLLMHCRTSYMDRTSKEMENDAEYGEDGV